MSKQFKVGDKVRCIRPTASNQLEGSVPYTITDTYTSIECLGVSSIRVNGDSHWWNRDRFIPYIKSVKLPEELFEL